MHPDHTRQPHG